MRKNHRGFTMTELAIVIGIVGMLMAGIWLFIGSAYDYERQQHALEEITTIVKNVRAFYQGQAGIPQSGITTISSNLISEGVIPSYMMRNPSTGCTNPNNLCADNPWGPGKGGASDPQGTLAICDWNPSASPAPTACNQGPVAGGGVVQFFAVVLKDLNQENCAAMLAKNSGSAGSPGLIAVMISNCSNAAGASIPLPISVTTALADCSCAAGAPNNNISFVYRLNPGSF
jgi:prepilin-type N-terminal cleavage/methylation domain-containing protein